MPSDISSSVTLLSLHEEAELDLDALDHSVSGTDSYNKFTTEDALVEEQKAFAAALKKFDEYVQAGSPLALKLNFRRDQLEKEWNQLCSIVSTAKASSAQLDPSAASMFHPTLHNSHVNAPSTQAAHGSVTSGIKDNSTAHLPPSGSSSTNYVDEEAIIRQLEENCYLEPGRTGESRLG
jgi:hypothetical protein